jgi:serine/threonine protein phosphatase PrpC
MKYALSQQSVSGSRPENQDRIACLERPGSLLMAVADGLGGYAGGAMAAATLVETVTRSFQKLRQPILVKPSEFLTLTILHAHRLINARAKSTAASDAAYDPRTTCVICLIQNGYAYWAHVGDSRLYHFRGGRLRSRTLDHTTTEMLRQDGVLSEENSKRGRLKSHLLRCVGGPQRPEVTLGEEMRLMPGDVLMLCSDGVWEAHDPDAIGRYLSNKDLEQATDELLLDAEAKMGDICDNLSVIAFRWMDKVTTYTPLQAGGTGNVDQGALWRAHKRELKAHQARAGGRDVRMAKRGVRDVDAIQSAIDEIEEYIKGLEDSKD